MPNTLSLTNGTVWGTPWILPMTKTYLEVSDAIDWDFILAALGQRLF